MAKLDTFLVELRRSKNRTVTAALLRPADEATPDERAVLKDVSVRCGVEGCCMLGMLLLVAHEVLVAVLVQGCLPGWICVGGGIGGHGHGCFENLVGRRVMAPYKAMPN